MTQDSLVPTAQSILCCKTTDRQVCEDKNRCVGTKGIQNNNGPLTTDLACCSVHEKTDVMRYSKVLNPVADAGGHMLNCINPEYPNLVDYELVRSSSTMPLSLSISCSK